MLAWIISIAGIMVLTVLFDIIMPEGETNKYIKGFFSIVVIIVIITPVTGFLGGGLYFDNMINVDAERHGVNYNFVNAIHTDSAVREQNVVRQFLATHDIEIERADLVFCPTNRRNILYVNIFVSKSVIENAPQNINISEEIRRLLSARYRIPREDVRVLVV